MSSEINNIDHLKAKCARLAKAMQFKDDQIEEMKSEIEALKADAAKREAKDAGTIRALSWKAMDATVHAFKTASNSPTHDTDGDNAAMGRKSGKELILDQCSNDTKHSFFKKVVEKPSKAVTRPEAGSPAAMDGCREFRMPKKGVGECTS